MMDTKDLVIRIAEEIGATRLIFIGYPLSELGHEFICGNLQVDYMAAKEWMKF